MQKIFISPIFIFVSKTTSSEQMLNVSQDIIVEE